MVMNTHVYIGIPKFTEKGHFPNMKDISVAERVCQSICGT